MNATPSLLEKQKFSDLTQTPMVSKIMPHWPHIDMVKFVEDFTLYMCRQVENVVGVPVEIRYNCDLFNSRGDIDYIFPKEKTKQTIVLNSRITEETALWALFFIMHGGGHIEQMQNGRAPLIEEHINPASVNPGYYYLEQPIKCENFGARFEDIFMHMEAEATCRGFAWVKKFINEAGFNIDQYVKGDAPDKAVSFYQDLSFCLTLIGVVDHTFHRSSTNERGIGTHTEAWFENFGLVMSNLLALWKLEHMGEPLQQKLPFPISIVRSDGEFHELTPQESSVLMGKYQQWQKTPPFPPLEIERLTNGLLPDSYQTQYHVHGHHHRANESRAHVTGLEPGRSG